MFRTIIFCAFLCAGSQAFAAYLNCQYINPANYFTSARMSAVVTDEEAQRFVPARSTYQYWGEGEDKNLPSERYLDYPATITSYMLEPGVSLLISIDNSQASETVQMKYDAYNKYYIGRRHVAWKTQERSDDPHSSIAICNVN